MRQLLLLSAALALSSVARPTSCGDEPTDPPLLRIKRRLSGSSPLLTTLGSLEPTCGASSGMISPPPP